MAAAFFEAVASFTTAGSGFRSGLLRDALADLPDLPGGADRGIAGKSEADNCAGQRGETAELAQTQAGCNRAVLAAVRRQSEVRTSFSLPAVAMVAPSTCTRARTTECARFQRLSVLCVSAGTAEGVNGSPKAGGGAVEGLAG